MTTESGKPGYLELAGVWPLRAYRVRRVAAIILAVAPPIACAFLARESGRWDLFERSGSITTAIGLVLASRRYIRYGVLELAVLHAQPKPNIAEILEDIFTAKLGFGALRIRDDHLGMGEVSRLVELHLPAGVGTVCRSRLPSRFAEGLSSWLAIASRPWPSAAKGFRRSTRGTRSDRAVQPGHGRFPGATAAPRTPVRVFRWAPPVCPGGVNFSVFSRRATRIELLLFDSAADAQPTRVIALDPRKHRTYHYWHVSVPGIGAGQLYAYRAFGPFDPEQGLRFDPSKALLDPYGRAVVAPDAYSRCRASRYGERDTIAMKSAVVDPGAYDWEGDEPLHRSFASTVIYEMHVAGFTRHPSSGVAAELRGTYAGMIEKIPYLRDLGITAVELLPIFQFDRQDCPPGLANYWGYSPVSFFAPHAGYSSRKDALGPVDEFRDLVKALHRAGIEVILDVVYNHTAEGNAAGPTLCFRGLANEVYYILDSDRAQYANYSGTGNTLNANQAIVRRMILDSLRYWVAEMHVDGFRFDLAAILARDETGRVLENPPALWDIESDPVLAGTKLIAEAWDAAGLYQLGSFIGDSWKEWNGRFRDDVRGFVKGDRGTVRMLLQRMLGSPGHLRAPGKGTRAEHQLRDLPRRLHAERSGFLQRQAQRGERRRQPGRD